MLDQAEYSLGDEVQRRCRRLLVAQQYDSCQQKRDAPRNVCRIQDDLSVKCDEEEWLLWRFECRRKQPDQAKETECGVGGRKGGGGGGGKVGGGKGRRGSEMLGNGVMTRKSRVMLRRVC